LVKYLEEIRNRAESTPQIVEVLVIIARLEEPISEGLTTEVENRFEYVTCQSAPTIAL